MQVKYKNERLMDICTNASLAERKYGKDMVEKIHMRIDQISTFPTIEMLICHNIGRCHALTGNRKGQFAIDLVHPYRLVFTITGMDALAVCITDITDYH